MGERVLMLPPPPGAQWSGRLGRETRARWLPRLGGRAGAVEHRDSRGMRRAHGCGVRPGSVTHHSAALHRLPLSLTGEASDITVTSNAQHVAQHTTRSTTRSTTHNT